MKKKRRLTFSGSDSFFNRYPVYVCKVANIQTHYHYRNLYKIYINHISGFLVLFAFKQWLYAFMWNFIRRQ